MTTSMLTLNAVLMLSVVVSIVSLLAWAIRTQHRDRSGQTVVRDATVRPTVQRSRRAATPRRKPVAGGV